MKIFARSFFVASSLVALLACGDSSPPAGGLFGSSDSGCAGLQSCCAKLPGGAQASCSQAASTASMQNNGDSVCQSQLNAYKSAGQCGAPTSTGTGGTSAGGAGGTSSGNGCAGLVTCCAGIADASARNGCVMAATTYAGMANGETSCMALLSGYQSTGMCGSSGVGPGAGPTGPGVGGGAGKGGTSGAGAGPGKGGTSGAGAGPGAGGTGAGPGAGGTGAGPGAGGTGAGGTGAGGTGAGGTGAGGSTPFGAGGTGGTSGKGGSPAGGTGGTSAGGTGGTSAGGTGGGGALCTDLAFSSAACGNCAHSACCAPIAACLNDASCDGIVKCIQGCAGDSTCANNCYSSMTAGQAKFDALDACISPGGACGTACGAAGTGGTGGTGGSSGTGGGGTGGGASCPAGSGSHSVCVAGTSLTSSSSACAAAVCAGDAYCCTTAWDATCAGADVKMYCSCSCPLGAVPFTEGAVRYSVEPSPPAPLPRGERGAERSDTTHRNRRGWWPIRTVATARMRVRADDLRRHETPTEKRLWRELRDRRLAGVKFRRQHVLGRFVVDFVAPGQRLVVEIDGSSHDGRDDFDASREQALRAMGYRVVRVTASDVEYRADRVRQSILAACHAALSSPLPSGERGRG